MTRPCADALHKYGRSLNVHALTKELARIDDEREAMLKALKAFVASANDRLPSDFVDAYHLAAKAIEKASA